MAKRYFFIPLLTAALLCMACDDPPVKTYTYQDLPGRSPTKTNSSFLGTYSVTKGYKDLFEGKPFAISFWATDATNAKDTLVRITPLSTGTEEMPMYRGTYSASATSATLRFTKLGMDYSLTAVPSFNSTEGKFTLKNSDGTKTLFTTDAKLDDYLMQMDEDDYYGTSSFLANANEDYVDGASWQFCDASGNGFYFPNGSQVCIRNVTTSSGATVNGTYDYRIVANRITIWKRGALKYEDDPVATFNYFITMASDGGDGSPHNLWVDGKWYSKVDRT